jgi:serine/threonine protein kinase
MSTLGKYEILEELGVGSMGTVYRARDTVLDREVALKTIRAGPSVEPEIKERFYREARACAHLQHPHIVTLYDFGEVNDAAYISMELLVGEDLRKVIGTKRNIPVGQKIELIAQVSDALAHAHRNEVVHRDIKPSNIFILKDNNAKVLDFGIARLPASKLTMLGKVLGTPNYMAPEQIQGNICDPRSDLFSLAIVFFELLTGTHPFQSAYIPRSIVGQPPTMLRSVDNTFSVALEQVLDKALQKSPEARFQTADEFSAALRGLLSEPPDVTTANSKNQALDNRAHTPQPASPSQTSTADQSAEARASEFFCLMQECDSAVEGKLLDKARKTLAQMKSLAEIDTRFSIAVLEYERQVVALEKASQPVENPVRPSADSFRPPSAPTTPPVGASSFTTPQAPLVSPSSSPSDVTRLFSMRDAIPAATTTAQGSGSFPSEGGLRSSDLTNDVPRGNVYIQDTPTPSQAVAPEKTFSARRIEETQTVHPSVADAAKRPLLADPRFIKGLGVVVCLAVLLVGGGLAVHFLNAPKYSALPAVGTAVVTSDTVEVFAGPSTDEKRLAVLKKGARLNITRRPRSTYPEWIAVQQVGDKPGAPGYVYTAALGRWSTFGLLQIFDPGDSAYLSQRIVYLDALHAGMAELGKADQNNAWLEIAHQNIVIAREKKASGVASDDWQKYIGEARQALAEASSDPSLGEQSKTMKDEIEGLLEPPPQAVPPTAPSTSPQPARQKNETAAEYRGAEDAYRLGQYARAVQLLKHILVVDKDNQGARILLEKVRKAAEEEAAASRGGK